METIRTYLDNMFVSLPESEEVKKAKRELFQMMEDKYNELIARGYSENEAVGTVISEFGNLDELAESLGLSLQEEKPEEGIENRVELSFEEGNRYIKEYKARGMQKAIGVMLCILSVVPPILDFSNSEMLGASIMFLMIGIAVVLFVYSSLMMKKWDYIKEGNYCLSAYTLKDLKNEKEENRKLHALMKTLGIVLCIICFIPVMVLDEMHDVEDVMHLENIGAASLFVFVAIGVFLIIYSSYIFECYDSLMEMCNQKNSDSQQDGKSNKSKKQYKNPMVAAIMSVYWSTVTCIYLSWSFLTFEWHITWIVWVIAVCIESFVNTIFEENEVE